MSEPVEKVIAKLLFDGLGEKHGTLDIFLNEGDADELAGLILQALHDDGYVVLDPAEAGWVEAEVEDIATEMGNPPRHVRELLAKLRRASQREEAE